ncbi:hypothetical protein OBBRIDRAFT_789996 [Obba rivulosa]|uniref:Oxidase ustYa n=1 Tax=Obba rivulosa TaxID=1052685 RepID=A0A8E2J321_9APHY|nr:hypothetical protein OBBRIDRAFT_789996 [Obba rivulosa]
MSFILLLASCLNFAYICWFTWTHHFNDMLSVSYSYHGHDFPETFPWPSDELPFASLTVEESAHYPLLGPESDDEWLSLTTASYGYVRLGPEDRLFALTMFHELHCLRVLNRAFGKAAVATPEHIQHCLNYLRQGVLCSPDLTLEPGNFEDKDFEVERTGATHTCRDWEAVYSVLDDNYHQWKGKTR